MNLPQVRYVEVSDNIVMMEPLNEGYPSEGNIVCLNIEDDLIFIDSTGISQLAANFRSEMEEKFQKKASYMILTHFHADHLFGMDAFNDIPIIGSQIGLNKFGEGLKGELSPEGRAKQVEEWKALSRERGEEYPENWAQRFLNAKLFLPKIGVKEEITIGNEDHRLIFRVVGGHSECSAYLFFEPDQILFTGDNLNADHAKRSPCFIYGLQDTSIDILKDFEKMKANKVVPGHGPVLDPSYIKESREYFSELFTVLRKMKTEGVIVEEAIKDPRIPAFYEKEEPEFMPMILKMWYEKI